MFFNSNKENDDSFWISYADLMTCVMIIFVFLIFSMIMYHKTTETTEKFNKSKIKETLISKGIMVDDDLNVFVSSDTKNCVYFAQSKSSLNEKEKRILNDFIPKFIHSIYDDEEVKNSIKEIRIQGYSSTEWSKNSTKQEKYINNMDLSQRRTLTAVNSIFNNEILRQEFEENKDLLNWLLQHLTANGFSSSNYVKDANGKEDKKKSRRITFSILLNKSESVLK